MVRSRSPILLIDDHDDVREGLQMILEHDGWLVESARDPRAALNRLFGGLQPCIMLMDLMSPLMNGADFHRELSGYPHLQRIPMIAYAGLTEVSAKARDIIADRASDVPADIAPLLTAVRQHCQA